MTHENKLYSLEIEGYGQLQVCEGIIIIQDKIEWQLYTRKRGTYVYKYSC